MLRLAVAFVLGTARVAYGDDSTPLMCVEVPGELAEPVSVRGAGTLNVVWGGKPVAENTVTAIICSPSATQGPPSYSLTGDGGTVLELGPNAATLKLSGAWNRLPALREAARFEVPSLAQVHHRLAACVDGIDNDGDGLRDEVDPGCSSLSDDSEENAAPTASTLAFKFATEGTGVFIESLSWKGIPVIIDPGTGKGNRFYLHSDSGTSGKWTSDIETFEDPLPRDPYQTPPGPWNANTTTWKNQTSPTRQIGNDEIKSTIISQNDTVVVVNTSTPAALFVDTFRFGADSITVTTDVTSLLPPSQCAQNASLIYFGSHFGNLQLGTTAGCKCPAVLISGHGSADGHGQANNCSAECESGLFHLDGLRRGAIQQGQPFNTMRWPIEPVTDPIKLKGWRTVAARGNAYPLSIFSPATALGDVKGFTIGMQMMNREINSDNTSTYTVEYYDIPAAPTKPLLSQYVGARMLPGETHTFNYVVQLAPAGDWANPKKAVTAVVQPYAQYFAKVFGSKPAYCPQGSVGMAFRGTSNKKFNKTTHTYPEGSSLYTDVLDVDTYLEMAPRVGIDTVMVWQGQIFSGLLMKQGDYEFNPNSQTLDPHVNEVCDAKWTNVTKALNANKLKLGWFGRPCNHIIQADGKSPATVTCPSKTIEYGQPVPCNLQNLSDPCTMQSMATVDALVAKGVQNFYWDSYLCAGRLTFSQAVVKKYPHAFIMGEQGIDTDSVLTGGLPWMGMTAGVWDPAFEPMNSVLMEIVNPMGTAIVAAYGADNNVNHTMYSLQSSKTNSLMVLIPNTLNNIFLPLPPDGKPPTSSAIQMRDEYCAQHKLSSANVLWRWQQYGKAMGCPEPPQLDESVCGPLPPIGYACDNATATKPATCKPAWPSTHTNATCMASCKSTLGNCTKTGCVLCDKPGPKCTYTCHETCHPHLVI